MIQGKSVILTGASMGLGRALVLALAERGAKVVINARNKSLLEETRSLVKGKNKPVVVAGDASQAPTAKTLVKTAVELGDFAGFIHAAGVFHPGPALWELSGKQYDEIFAANTKAGWQLIRHAVPALIPKQKGLAVFLGSKAADIIQPGIATYCAAKLALENICTQLAAEAPWLTTFVYRPGLVDTRMQRQAREAEGGSASPVRTMFGGWHEKGYLVSPEKSAARLVETITGDLTGLSGTIVDFAAKKKRGGGGPFWEKKVSPPPQTPPFPKKLCAGFGRTRSILTRRKTLPGALTQGVADGRADGESCGRERWRRMMEPEALEYGVARALTQAAPTPDQHANHRDGGVARALTLAAPTPPERRVGS